MTARLLKSLFRLTSVMSLPIAHRIGRFFGWLLIRLPNKSKTVAKKNIELCFPELTAQQQKTLLDSSLIESGKTLAEMGIIWLANSERVLSMITSVEGERHLQDAVKQNKGVLLAMPHIGSWELVNLFVARHYPVTSLYKPQKYPSVDSIIKQARQRTGATLVPTDTAGVRAVTKALKSGQLIVILPDQQPYLHLKNGVFADFFATPAYSMTLMSKLAAKLDSEIIYAYSKRQANGKGFTLVFTPASENNCKQDIQHSVELMNKDIETVIRDCPEQYQWTYKRFKSRPAGLKRFY
ncbi:MAG: lysophospholipid acyltransferase family protein [Gammaproteobacteria bacterium]|nr:lysophospholipid acyltransferase family protein [Gammaproteobacteria bacterium]